MHEVAFRVPWITPGYASITMEDDSPVPGLLENPTHPRLLIQMEVATENGFVPLEHIRCTLQHHGTCAFYINFHKSRSDIYMVPEKSVQSNHLDSHLCVLLPVALSWAVWSAGDRSHPAQGPMIGVIVEDGFPVIVANRTVGEVYSIRAQDPRVDFEQLEVPWDRLERPYMAPSVQDGEKPLHRNPDVGPDVKNHLVIIQQSSPPPPALETEFLDTTQESRALRRAKSQRHSRLAFDGDASPAKQ